MISPRHPTFRVPSFSSNPASRYFTASSAILLQAGGELCCHLGIKIDTGQLVHFLDGKLCEDNNRLDVFISRINTIRPVASHPLTVLIVAFTGGGGGGGSGGFSVSRYSSYSRDGDRERERYHHSDRDSDRYSSSRYSTVTSPTSSRRTTSNYSSSSSSYSRFLPSSRWTPHHYSDEEPEEERDHVRDRDGRRVQRGETKTTTEGEI